jgi:hypothetical protein
MRYQTLLVSLLVLPISVWAAPIAGNEGKSPSQTYPSGDISLEFRWPLIVFILSDLAVLTPTGNPAFARHELLAKSIFKVRDEDLGSSGLKMRDEDLGSSGLKMRDEDLASSGLKMRDEDLGSGGLKVRDEDLGSGGLKARVADEDFASGGL